MKIDFSIPKAVLPFLKNKVDDFYLAGGTALSMFYYEHRESFDLDFFTRQFSRERILKLMDELKKNSKWEIDLIAEQNKENLIRMAVYLINIDKNNQCKIDFVEDYIKPMHPLKKLDGINILSLEDIYLRKIYTFAGHISTLNEIGQKVVLGGRQEAKDIYDVYCLSTITMPLSEFVSRFCNHAIKEGVVRWYQTYDRMNMKTGLLDLPTKSKPEYPLIENHFKQQIDKLLESLIEGE
jgi:predicted nucleotidyltransferase component of viral defense system